MPGSAQGRSGDDDPHHTGARLLGIAVIVQSVMDLSSRDPETRIEARAWFEAPATGSPLFEFRALCEALGIAEPAAIVERVLHHRVRVTRDDFLAVPRRGRRRLGR
jgi:hypothetical protein